MKAIQHIMAGAKRPGKTFRFMSIVMNAGIRKLPARPQLKGGQMFKRLFIVSALIVLFESPVFAEAGQIFPQFPDGRFSDGYYYSSTLQILNPSSNTSVECTLLFRGVKPSIIDIAGNQTTADAFTITMAPGESDVLRTTGEAPFQAGYLTLQCSGTVSAIVMYTYHNPAGIPLSGAAVFPSSQGNHSVFVADQRNGARLGIAINNDSDVLMRILVEARSSVSELVSAQSIIIPPRASVAQFIDQFLVLAPDFVGQIHLTADSDKLSAIGFRYSGHIFATIPPSTYQR
jgi:hypothetical protein